MTNSRFVRPGLFLTTATLLGLASPLSAGVVATDSALPANMSTGGSEADPAQYILGDSGAITHNQPTYNNWLGYNTAFNHLSVRNASAYHVGYLWIGSLAAGTDNRLHVTGGSTASFGYGLEIGLAGARNHAVFDGGSQTTVNFLHVGKEATSTGNTVRVDGPDTRLASDSILRLGPGGGDNTLSIENGGLFETASTAYVGTGSDGNTVQVDGTGSRWSHTGSFHLGSGSTDDNRLLVSDGGLVELSTYINFGDATGNFVGLDGGFLAFAGDLEWFIDSMLFDGRLRVRDAVSGDWIQAGAADLDFDYFIDESAALAFSGHEGLGGYTILTAAAGSPIPEPAAFAALAGLTALGFTASRRRGRR